VVGLVADNILTRRYSSRIKRESNSGAEEDLPASRQGIEVVRVPNIFTGAVFLN